MHSPFLGKEAEMMLRMTRTRLLMLALLLTAFLGGCHKAKPDYARPLPPGAFGLRRITDPARMPDLSPVARQLSDRGFAEALDRSVRWFSYPSSKQFFPSGPISHVHAWTSVYALQSVGRQDPASILTALEQDFDVWESVGWDGSGEVLFTGYYSPTFRASHTKTGEFQYPLYTRPADLVTDPATGEIVGRKTQAGVVAFPGRAEIERSGMLAGTELVYLPDKFEAYLIHVNGSAKLTMTDGSTMYIGYAGNSGHDYTSIGKLLVAEGKLDGDRLSLPAIRTYFRQHPEDLDNYIGRNERFVFFQEYDGGNWPAGSMGFRATPMRTLATDKTIFPRGSVVLLNTTIPTRSGAEGSFDQLMLDQDTGGAIRAAGRADIYIGIGNDAENIAGRQAAPGRLYYFFLKPQRVQSWYDRMQQQPRQASTSSTDHASY
jgi:membrane-bound lytic murein transglycosylase A